jgi:hypothetical protein
MARDPVSESRSAPAGVAFEVDRFEWTARDRLELAGRWVGLRGQRFMRPALTVESAEGNRRMLALLEHKPWAPDADGPWIAAFPWDGDPVALDMAELAVAPSIAVRLPPPDAPGGSARRAPAKRTATRARGTKLELETARAEAADLRERLSQARDEARELGEGLERARDRAGQEREAALEARDGAEAEMRRLEAERDDARAEAASLRDEAGSGLRSLEAERDAAVAEVAAVRESLGRERSELGRRLDAAVRERDVRRERGSAALAERDAAIGERDAAMAARDVAVAARDVAVRARDAAIATRPDLAPAPIGTRTRRRDVAGQLDRPRPAPAPWAARILALAALAALVVAVVALLHGAL